MSPSHADAAPDAPLDGAQVARLLLELARLSELAGDNPYKARAYARAAEALSALPLPLGELVARSALRDIPGVGPAIADKIARLHRTGTDPALEALRRRIPAGLVEMLAIPGLSAKQALQVHRKSGIETVVALQEACARGDLAAKGFAAALERKVLQGLELQRRGQGRRLLHRATELMAEAAAHLARSRPELQRIAVAGDVRRGCELVADLRLVAQVDRRVREIGEIALDGDIRLHLADERRYGVALVLATGSPEHVEGLRAVAAARGFSLDGRGLRRQGRLVPCREEAQVYAALGLPPIPPELREGRGEIERAAAGGLPDLVAAEDLRGVLHSHTDASDGADTLEEMAAAARARGWEYFGVADHSRTAAYAGGLTLPEIEAQHALADGLNRRSRGRFRVFKGIESDILPDGALDYPDEVLGRFDFVVASVHGRFGLDERAQTERILRAVANPHTTILGHMTGRMLLRREGYEIDIERVLAACAEHGVAVEINANPHRLDLDWRWHARALELGCLLSINPDAHSIAELDLTRWGVLMARKGGVPRERVLNSLDRHALAEHFQARRRRRENGRSGRVRHGARGRPKAPARTRAPTSG